VAVGVPADQLCVVGQVNHESADAGAWVAELEELSDSPLDGESDEPCVVGTSVKVIADSVDAGVWVAEPLDVVSDPPLDGV
jgi:hypothetical protein